jgi:hypothetical protein
MCTPGMGHELIRTKFLVGELLYLKDTTTTSERQGPCEKELSCIIPFRRRLAGTAVKRPVRDPSREVGRAGANPPLSDYAKS